jgi:hypothetical protein
MLFRLPRGRGVRQKDGGQENANRGGDGGGATSLGFNAKTQSGKVAEGQRIREGEAPAEPLVAARIKLARKNSPVSTLPLLCVGRNTVAKMNGVTDARRRFYSGSMGRSHRTGARAGGLRRCRADREAGARMLSTAWVEHARVSIRVRPESQRPSPHAIRPDNQTTRTG